MSRLKGRILIVRGGAIGDFILTLPVLTALRDAFPETHLQLLAYPAVAGLALKAGLVDSTLSMDSRALARFFARNAELPTELTTEFEPASIIVSYLYDPDEIFAANLGRCGKARFLQGPHRPNEGLGVHASRQLLKPLEALAIFDADPVACLPWPPDPKPPERGSRRGGTPVVAIHPGSGSPSKNWPLHSWKELTRRLLAETQAQILILGGEAEGDQLDYLLNAFPNERMRCLRSRPLEEVATALTQCELFVGHDSGITHLASALGLSTHILWGPTHLQTWAPISPKTSILRSQDGLEQLHVNTVFQALVTAANLR